MFHFYDIIGLRLCNNIVIFIDTEVETYEKTSEKACGGRTDGCTYQR